MRLPGCKLTEQDFNTAIDKWLEENKELVLEEFTETFEYILEDINKFLENKSKDLEPMSNPKDSAEDDIYDSRDDESIDTYERAYQHKEVTEFGLWVHYTVDKITKIRLEYW